MSDFVLGVLAIGVGAVFCFRGFLAMRVIIPIWGAFAGFVFGAGLVTAAGHEFLATGLSWMLGIAFALLFGLLAYLYYAVAVLIGMSAIGFVLGTSVMTAIGVSWSWLIILAGVASALVLAFVAIVGDMPMVLLTLLTALAGATAIVTGLMLIFGVVQTGDLNAADTTKTVNDGWGWYALYAVLAIAGMVAQFTDTDRRAATLRAEWYGAGA